MNNSTVSIQHATAASLGGGFLAADEVAIAEMSNVSISHTIASEQGGGFQVAKRFQLTNGSTLNLDNVKAGKHGGGLFASGQVEILGSSTVKISNSQAVSGDGGGFRAYKEIEISNGSTLIIVNAKAGGSGGGFYSQEKVAMRSSTVSISHASAVQNGGGFNALGEVQIAESSTVQIDNSQAVTGGGGGFVAENELEVSSGSTLIILKATARGNGGGFYASGKVAMSNATVSIQHAAAGQHGGGFYVADSIALAACTVAMSGTYAGIDGGGFMVFGGLLTIYNGSMSMANSTTMRTGAAGRVYGLVLLSSQSTVDIHQAKGDESSSILVARCLQLHPNSNLVLKDINGGHGVDLQNSGCSPLCSNTTFQVADGAALNATGRLSSGLLSVEACPHEEVRLSGIHLHSWNSSLLTTRPSYVVINDVDIHYQPPVDNLQILDAEEGFCPGFDKGTCTSQSVISQLRNKYVVCSYILFNMFEETGRRDRPWKSCFDVSRLAALLFFAVGRLSRMDSTSTLWLCPAQIAHRELPSNPPSMEERWSPSALRVSCALTPSHCCLVQNSVGEAKQSMEPSVGEP